MYKKYYSKFLKANPQVQHYAAHSHHYWPDVTYDAMIEYWNDSAKYTDDKWDYFFSNKIPTAQKLIAEVLNLSQPEQIVFAPNTHELVYRLLSCLDNSKPVHILTTDSEFYSFDRQINRLAEMPNYSVDKISTEDFSTFEERLKKQINTKKYNFIFFSHVFFNSGYAIKDLQAIVNSVSDPDCLIVIDGYHSFMALPTDLHSIEKRAFYIGGSYKYAQGGEGCCFLYVPSNCLLRPLYTGWFAGFADLTGKGGNVVYSNDGLRFAGSTMDFTALYRLVAVLELFRKDGLTVDKIHRHVQFLQSNFRNYLSTLNHHYLNEKNILSYDYAHHGHFFAFELKNEELVRKIHDDLSRKKIKTDYRATRLRFGFGLYQDEKIDLSHV